MARMSKQEKAVLDRMSRQERAAYLKAHRKPPIPAPRSYDAKESALRKQKNREKIRLSHRDEPDLFFLPCGRRSPALTSGRTCGIIAPMSPAPGRRAPGDAEVSA